MKAKEFIKNNKKKVGAATMAALLFAGGATYAYFTDSNVLTNTFNIGNIDSTLVEEAWDAADPSEHENLAPNAVIAKDPKVINNGTLPAYTFIKSTVPVKDIKVASEDGTQVTGGEHDMFSWTINDGWVLVDTIDNGDTKTYVYAWAKDGKMTVVEPNGGETSTLYDNIKLANIVEGQGIEGTDLDVVNTDVTIQSDNVKATDPASVWKIASGQQSSK